MNNCKNNRSAHWRYIPSPGTREPNAVLYHWRGWHCGVIENTHKSARSDARCEQETSNGRK